MASTTGTAARAGIAFVFGRLLAKVFGFAAGFLFVSAGLLDLTTLAAPLRIFLAAGFLAGFTGFLFEIFAPVFAWLSLALTRAGRGLAAAVFFGFFMTTILATGWGCCWRLSPAFGWRNGYLNWDPQAPNHPARARVLQLIGPEDHPKFYLAKTAKSRYANNPQSACQEVIRK